MFNIYSEDPIASSDTVKSTPTEIPAMEESVPVCLCQNCPDLEKEQFSRCCHSNVKAKGICTKLAIQCICLSPKLEKFFDKVRYEFTSYLILKLLCRMSWSFYSSPTMTLGELTIQILQKTGMTNTYSARASALF